MKNNITTQIESGYADLRKSEKQAADYILDHMDQAQDLPLDRLAKAAGVSQPTVLRMRDIRDIRTFATSWSPSLLSLEIVRKIQNSFS